MQWLHACWVRPGVWFIATISLVQHQLRVYVNASLLTKGITTLFSFYLKSFAQHMLVICIACIQNQWCILVLNSEWIRNDFKILVCNVCCYLPVSLFIFTYSIFLFWFLFSAHLQCPDLSLFLYTFCYSMAYLSSLKIWKFGVTSDKNNK